MPFKIGSLALLTFGSAVTVYLFGFVGALESRLEWCAVLVALIPFGLLACAAWVGKYQKLASRCPVGFGSLRSARFGLHLVTIRPAASWGRHGTDFDPLRHLATRNLVVALGLWRCPPRPMEDSSEAQVLSGGKLLAIGNAPTDGFSHPRRSHGSFCH